MTLPPQFRSGDIIRMETSDGPIVAHLVDLDDRTWIHFDWDFPRLPDPFEDDDR